jgi:hypothetical protein
MFMLVWHFYFSVAEDYSEMFCLTGRWSGRWPAGSYRPSPEYHRIFIVDSYGIHTLQSIPFYPGIALLFFKNNTEITFPSSRTEIACEIA